MLSVLIWLMLGQQPSAEDFTSVIDIYSKYAERINNDKYWSRVRVLGPDGKEKSFDDMDAAERRMLIMLFAQKMTAEGQKIQEKWEKLEIKPMEGKSSISNEQLKSFSGKLLEQRKRFAKEYERFLEANSKHIGKLVNQYELDDLIKTTRKNHEALKLSEGR